MDEESDVGSGVGSSDADVVQSAVVSQGDGADSVDLVAADPVVCFVAAVVAGGCFGSGLVGRGRSGAVLEGSVWSQGVVLVAEPVEVNRPGESGD